MSEINEFEEGEIGDLSDFEDSHSQPSTPLSISKEIENKLQSDKINFPNSKRKNNCKTDLKRSYKLELDESNFKEINDNFSPKTNSLLELLSDDNDCTIPKPKTVHKNKRKKREWNRLNKRRQIHPLEKARCRFYLEGRCTKGLECPFSHEFVPDKKQELCKFYAVGSCGKGSSCQFLHGEFPCKFFHLTHNCYHGNNCKFFHGQLTPDLQSLLDRSVTEKDPMCVEMLDNNCATNDGSIHQPFSSNNLSKAEYQRTDIICHNPIKSQQLLPMPGLPPVYHDQPPNFNVRGLPTYVDPRLPHNYSHMNLEFNGNPNRPNCPRFPNNFPMRGPFRLPPRRQPNLPYYPPRCRMPFNFAIQQNQVPAFHSPNVITKNEIVNKSTNGLSCQKPQHNIESKMQELIEDSENTQDRLPNIHVTGGLTVYKDFVIPLIDVDDEKLPKWIISQLDVEEKSSHSIVNIEKTTNDPRLQAKLNIDPRLYPNKLKTTPVLSVIPECNENKEKLIQHNPASNMILSDYQMAPVTQRSKRRVKLQLNEMASNFVPSDSATNTEDKHEKPHLLDPRLNRRQVVSLKPTEPDCADSVRNALSGVLEESIQT